MRNGFSLGVKEALPLAASVFGYGVAWGALADQGGFSASEISLMSAVVFAGASQFVAVGMLGAGAGSGEIVLATLLLNLRHLLMGASLAPFFKGLRTWKLALLAHLITDESYALSIGHFRAFGGSVPYFVGAGGLIGVSWLASSLMGSMIGKAAIDPAALGLDFAFLGAFLGLLVPQLRGRGAWTAFGTAALVALCAGSLLPGKWYILIAAVAAAVAGAAVEARGGIDAKEARNEA